MDIQERLTELARITRAPGPVVSVYLNTRWADEHQRERARVFLKTEVRKARKAPGGAGLGADLDWIQSQGEALVSQALVPEADGVALFACQALGLRETLPIRVPFEDAFVVADAPFLRPLVGVLADASPMVVVFVDGESARLIPLYSEGAGEEVTLESEVPGRHRRGGWAQLAQSRYQRHIQDHRGRHFDAVADALVQLAEGHALGQIVVAGEPRTVGAFRKHLPRRIAERIVGNIPAERHEPASALVTRAGALLGRREGEAERAGVDAVLAEAAESRRAVAGLEATLDAVFRGAVHRLYLLEGFRRAGQVCGACGALQNGSADPCRRCGKGTDPVELGEAIVQRVLAAGGTVETVAAHEKLAAVGGMAARLRFPL
jgi:peptide subunit release factor 1 (eRF1)